MGEAYIDLLKAFGFKEMQIWIATMSALMFSGNLLGGILTGLMLVNSNTLAQRPLKDRISFRLFALSEVILVIFIFYYHLFMIEDIKLAHVVYWISAIMMLPLLAIIGSQIMQVTFSGRMKAKEEAMKRQQAAARAKRAEDVDKTDKNAPAKPAGSTAGVHPPHGIHGKPATIHGSPADKFIGGKKGKPA